ncbi:uncharacterized protein [Montipora capricornis]|uniref:uncharacterized protein n=1 Tax=Montipora capricornis TaxID=246305 RepID=UPI0035F136C8
MQILAISESWLNSSVKNAEVEIDGYSLLRLERPRNIKNEFGGGVCAYMRKTLKSKVLKDLSGISDTGFHQLWMQVQHKTLKSFLLCVTYKPPDCNVACFKDFRDRYTQALVYGLPILVVGDLNCDLLVNSSNSRTLNNLGTSLNMKQLITQPTRVTEISKTLIDVIFTSNPAIIVDSGIVETHFSDHYLVFAVLNLRMPKPPAAYVFARSYKYYDRQSFLSDLNKIPWYEIILSDDVNEKLLHFNGAFVRVLENHAPIKEIKIKHRRCPFINEEIKEKMAKRDQAHKIARETGALVDWQYYRDCRNDVKTVLREAEKEYVQNEIKNNQSSSERWKELPVSFIPEEDEFQFRAATSSEINRIVQSFPSNKAPGKDKLHMAVVKDALPAILPTLTEIINSSLLTSVFPSPWKESEIVPIPKDGGDPEVANENRPVSLLPALSKICERVALNQFTEYATRRNCLSGHQSGNKKRHSTETLNILTSDLALEAMDRKQVTALVLLDLPRHLTALITCPC